MNSKITIFLILFCSSIVISKSDNPAILDSSINFSVKYSVVSDSVRTSFSNTSNLYIFSPHSNQIKKDKYPCVIFCPKYGNTAPEYYRNLINFIVGHGIIVVVPPYKAITFGRKQVERNNISLDYFTEIVSSAKNIIDTTKIGYVGHGFGAGFIPSLAKRVSDSLNWGKEGTFMYLMSPWYFNGITKRELESFPTSINLVVQSFENDNINDPLIAANLYSMIGIPPKNKEYYMLFSSKFENKRLVSDFSTPLSNEAIGGEDNILDTAGIYIICNSLINGVFNNNELEKRAVLGNGKKRQIPIGEWKEGQSLTNMVATDSPFSLCDKKPYINMWISARNPIVERNNFKKARKLYLQFAFRKIEKLTKFIIKTKKAEHEVIDSLSEDIDTFENPIAEGYGSNGKFSTVIDSVENPLCKEHKILFFHPKEIKKATPLAVLIHGYSGPDYHYMEHLINHIVSKGYAVLYPPYPNRPLATNEKKIMDKIKIIYSGINVGIKKFTPYIDSSKVIIMGQSFGAGIVPKVGYKLFTEKKWGETGSALYIMAPWYSYDITEKELQSFPKNTKLLMEVFDSDQTNDHQMAVDIFNNINVPKSEKDYIILNSDSYLDYTIRANHFVPYGKANIYGEENFLDYYGMFRYFDALVDYSFNKKIRGKDIALGNGNRKQLFMGNWSESKEFKHCTETDNPKAYKTQYQYFYAWENPLNPRLKFYKKIKILPSLRQR